DGGATWTRLGKTTISSGVHVLFFPAPRTVLAGGCGIWRSTNGGRTFMNTLACTPRGSDNANRNIIRLAGDPHQPQMVYAGVSVFDSLHRSTTPELWRSADGGVRWRRLSQAGDLFALDPVLARTVYLAVGGTVWRSIDQ